MNRYSFGVLVLSVVLVGFGARADGPDELIEKLCRPEIDQLWEKAAKSSVTALKFLRSGVEWDSPVENLKRVQGIRKSMAADKELARLLTSANELEIGSESLRVELMGREAALEKLSKEIFAHARVTESDEAEVDALVARSNALQNEYAALKDKRAALEELLALHQKRVLARAQKYWASYDDSVQLWNHALRASTCTREFLIGGDRENRVKVCTILEGSKITTALYHGGTRVLESDLEDLQLIASGAKVALKRKLFEQLIPSLPEACEGLAAAELSPPSPASATQGPQAPAADETSKVIPPAGSSEVEPQSQVQALPATP